MIVKFKSKLKHKKYICLPENFNTNISHQLFDYKITLCEFTAQIQLIWI